MTREIDEIIIHCSATQEGKNYTVEDIDYWHRQRGWKCIGYHYVIYLNGSINKGRDVSEVGAHCAGHNSHSIGVCYIGGVDSKNNSKDTRTTKQKDAMEVLLKQLLSKYPTITKITGHNKYAAKDCPCFDVEKEYSYLLGSNG